MSLVQVLANLNADDRDAILSELVIKPTIEQDRRLSDEEYGNILRAGRKLGYDDEYIVARIDEELVGMNAVRGDSSDGFDERNGEDYEGLVARKATPKVAEAAEKAPSIGPATFLIAYHEHEKDRAKLGIPPIPLHPGQVEALASLLAKPPAGKEQQLMHLLAERVAPGVDPAAKVKVDFLAGVAFGRHESPLVTPEQAVELLGTMRGGFNLAPLVQLLSHETLAGKAADELSRMVLANDVFEEIDELREAGNEHAARIMDAWAKGEWFTSRDPLPARITVTVFKVDGETNTDDLSPAPHAATRPDIPLHALAMLESLDPEGLATIKSLKEKGYPVAYVGDVVGTGSSRKSACNSVMWCMGDDIPNVPNKRTGAVVLGGKIAPIFFNTTRDSGGLPLECDVGGLSTGQVITIDTRDGKILDEKGGVITTFKIEPNTVPDEWRAGGRMMAIIGRQLTGQARETLGLEETDLFAKPTPPEDTGKGFSLAQKMVGMASGLEGVRPGQYCEPKATTVGSQDTTGPMTADEMMELACQKFLSPLVMQSFCHTAAYPKPADIKMFKTLPMFIGERGGVALRPGDGIIHSWLNRMLVPDTVGTGGDSHTRFPLGISFPAGSGLVAFAAALGVFPLDMPESILVRFKGELRDGITLRDVVNAIPYWAIKKGLVSVGSKDKVNCFNGRILEMEGLPDLMLEQAFELTDAAAERSAEATCIQLSEETVATYLKSNVVLLESMIEDGYQDANTLRKRIAAQRAWLADPQLLKADSDAEYAEVIEIDLSEIDEPILACPNDPDNVKKLSEAIADAGGEEKVHDVFIGSCMTNIGHYRAAGKLLEGGRSTSTLWVCPPTRMDEAQLRDEGYYATFAKSGARTEIPGCSLCMGNQARVADNVTVFSTSTRNFNNRMGRGAQVYLGSAELAAVVALEGALPSPERYFEVVKKLDGQEEEVYRYLQFDETGVPKAAAAVG